MIATLIEAHAGAPDGAELTGARWLTGWSFEPLPLVAIVVAAGLYLVGVQRLQAAGNPWPVGRTAAFAGGLIAALIATSSAMATYDTVLLSAHMLQHMTLSMLVPILLALGAPITLALRTLPGAPRARLLSVIHSRVAAVLTFPVFAGAIFIVNPFVLYFSGYYEATLRNPWLHEVNHLHFVLIGCLWFWPLLGIDPMPRRIGYPQRVIAVFLTLPFHAFLGVAIMSMNTLIAAEWYLEVNRDWGASLLADQRTAGGILWVSGDLISLVIFAALFRQWVRASEREARREDRRLDRIDALAARGASLRSGSPGARLGEPSNISSEDPSDRSGP
ncbi:MAG: cytochrome c oxidase assembly protein [Sporichthyaceae bacterium]